MKKQYITPAAETIAFATEGIMNNISSVQIDSSASGDEQYSNRGGAASSQWSEDEANGDFWE
ncbi:MAG: hypothetical protein KIG47_03390 [Prevotellamassilia sp.]|nr:hypothetical protein [Prevotellamassilia sp.]